VADVMSPEQRSRVMARNTGTNTSPERRIDALLAAAGVPYTRHDKTLPRRPDFVFATDWVAVFVDGDFWHGWRFPVWRHRLSEFWRTKIAATRERDRRTHRRLRRAGWRVVRIWEHQVETDSAECVQRISTAVEIVDALAASEQLVKLPLLAASRT